MGATSFWILLALVLGTLPAPSAGVPRVAVWDPVSGTSETRFTFDPDAIDRIARWGREAGLHVDRLPAERFADPAAFSTEHYDAAVVVGSAFPRTALGPLLRFSEAGGVLVSLGAQVPFLILLESGEDGQWVLSPREPRFAWQTDAVLKHVGLEYRFDPALHSQGVVHEPSSLLRRYVPNAPVLRGRLESRWIVPRSGGTDRVEYIPLIASLRHDRAGVPGPLAIVRQGRRHAILGTDPMFLFGTNPALWPHSRETVVAVLRMASELRHGTLPLAESDAIPIRSDLPPLPPAPLDRMATGAVDPEGALPLARWGRFDGSCVEFGPALSTGRTATVASPENLEGFPHALEPGASLRLAIPFPGAAGDGLHLRVRGAFLKSDAALAVALGRHALLAERFVYIDTSAPGNFSRSLSGQPVEFTRIVFVPSNALRDASEGLTLTNPGTEPVFFDALQLERQQRPGRTRCIGLGAGQEERNQYGTEYSLTWGGIRTSLRTQRMGPPGDPDRFAPVDKLFGMIAAKNPVVQPILEGTPPWAAISPERLKEAQEAKRPSTVPPDPSKYAEIVAAVVERYGANIETYEIWNEADITQFYRGSAKEYVELFHSVAPVIRKLAPQARIMTTGMAGYREEFLRALHEGGVLAAADLFAFHPYAGKSAAWDLPYGLVEGFLLSRGHGIEVFCNESGFPRSNAEWFQPPPLLTEDWQRDALDTAMARLLANGLAKLSVFNAGGDEHAYGLIDGAGRPRPAYAVIADYALLNGPGSTRLDIGMVRLDGKPLQGVYAAASAHADGRVTVVLNPADCEALRSVEDQDLSVGQAASWTCFFGTVRHAQGQATVEPETGKSYAGFYTSALLDPVRHPRLAVAASGPSADWEMVLKLPGGLQVPAVPRCGAGTQGVDLAALLAGRPTGPVEVSFRVYGPTTFERVRLLADPALAAPVPVALAIRLPFPAEVATATARWRSGAAEPQILAVALHGRGAQRWAETIVSVAARGVLEWVPGNSEVRP